MNETLLYLLGIVLLLAGVGFSIGWHELGHLIPAKLFKVRVPQYMIGFGPTLFSKRIGETEYGIKAIPLGGYISMIGMFLPAKSGKTKELAPWQTKGIIGFFRSMIAEARPKPGSIEAADLNRQFHKLNPLKRMVIMFGGPFMNLILGFALLAIALSAIGVNGPSNRVLQVIDCVPAAGVAQACAVDSQPSPAKVAGIKNGDRVIAVNSKPISSWAEAKSEMAKAGPGSVSLTLLRDSSKVTVNIKPVFFSKPLLDEKGQIKVPAGPYVGVFLASEIRHFSLSEVAQMSGDNVTGVFTMLGHLPTDLSSAVSSTLTGQERSASGPISIVGLSNLAGEVASAPNADLSMKIANGLMMLASLNFALFAFNMIPLLPLDGGHIASAIYESIKRGAYRMLGKKDPGPADTALLVPITWFVFIALFAMSIVLIAADLINPISLK